MQVEKLRSLIRESINEYIKEIDIAAEGAAMEARITKCEEAIQMRETKLDTIAESDHNDLIDESKVKNIENEIKVLKKAKAKFEKQREKMQAKKDKKENPKKEMTTDAPVEEADVTAEMDMDMSDKPKEEALNESFLKMQKLAGVITEGQYNSKKKVLNEATERINFGPFKKVEVTTIPRENIARLNVLSSDNFYQIDINGKATNKDVENLAQQMSDYLTQQKIENEIVDVQLGYGQDIDNLEIEIPLEDLNKLS